MTKNTLKSIAAIFVGLITVFVLSHLTDFVLKKTGVMKIPFDQNPLGIMIIVTIYRSIYVVGGCYIAATLAPDKPMLHAMGLGAIGFALGVLGAIAMWDKPPHWYPIALIILALPCAWLGGKLKR